MNRHPFPCQCDGCLRPLYEVLPDPALVKAGTPSDPITLPSHYRAGRFECRDVIAALGLNFNRGSAMKYLWRAGRKVGADELTDLRKAAECIAFEIRQLEAGK